jgi:CheY-like chemotaxis protein
VLNNAAKYTPADGRIRLDVTVDDRQAVIRVCDTGIGISAEILPHIFDYFVQEAPGSEVNRKGLGVGLALAHQLIELHGGTIEASSGGRGKGSEFTIRLPLSLDQSEDSAPATLVAAGQQTRSGPRYKILIIDDEHDVADLLASVLRHAGHQVWTAYSGQIGIETAQECRPEVALIDLSMPDMDGHEVARQLRGRMPQTLLIALSGLVNASDHERSLAAGFDYHLAKPATLRQIEVLCAKPRRQSPSAGK